jgi:dihydroorotate dehydrogenase electron transfer subunit
MIQETCKVVTNRLIADDYYELVFSWNEKCKPEPGQFLTIKPEGLPLLRRPFAYSGFKDGTASIIYKTVGEATKGFSNLSPGENIDILGPLGTSFSETKKRPLLVAGGIGLGPMLFTADHLGKKGQKPLLIIGARNSGLIPELKLNKNVELIICTDDGSQGFKGNVVEYLEAERSNELESMEIFCCGPHIMLKSCHNLAIKMNIECQVSMEEMMACAVGACYGCVVETTLDEKYKRVCKDGPVFKSREIIWT